MIVEIIILIVLLGVIAALGWYAWHSAHKTTKPASSTTLTQVAVPATSQATPDPYAGWKTYDYKNLFSFKYPSDYHYSVAGEGDNTIAITSYTYNPNGIPTDYHCSATGYNVPDCDVKVELTWNDGSIGSAFFPANSKLKATAQLIITSAKKD